jgi:hypothetical protein
MHDMSEPFHVITVGPVLQWAREHPQYFFANGVPSAESLVEQLAAGARALGAREVEMHSFLGWFVVAASDDWFANARFPVPENFEFQALTPFPEYGQNCVRPEAVVAAFAREVVVRKSAAVHVVKGTVAASDAGLLRIAEAPAWQRAIAFRGVNVV